MIHYEVIENEYSTMLAVTNFAVPKGKSNNLTFSVESHLFTISLSREKAKQPDTQMGYYFSIHIGEYLADREWVFIGTAPSPC